MTLFLTKSTLTLDVVYNVTEYRKYYDDDYAIYSYLIKLTTVGDTNTYTMYLNEGPIYDRLFGGNTTPFSIKKISIDNGSGYSKDIITIVGDHDWKTLV